MLINQTNDPIYSNFIESYEQQILTNFPILKDYNINLTDDDDGHLPSDWNDTNCNSSPYACDINIMTIVRYKQKCDSLSEQTHYALIAHEIGHICIKCNGLSYTPDVEEQKADEFATQIGLRTDLKAALEICKDIVDHQNTDHMLEHFFQNYKSNQLLEIQKRIDSL